MALSIANALLTAPCAGDFVVDSTVANSDLQLPALKFILGFLTIHNNLLLTNLDGLSNLVGVQAISFNVLTNVVQINGLSKLRYVNDSIVIYVRVFVCASRSLGWFRACKTWLRYRRWLASKARCSRS